MIEVLMLHAHTKCLKINIRYFQNLKKRQNILHDEMAPKTPLSHKAIFKMRNGATPHGGKNS